MPDGELRLAIREAHALGLKVLVKPHVWVEGSWAGTVEPTTAEDRQIWFDRYRAALIEIARTAAEENAEALVIGTELERTSARPQWRDIIAAVRTEFHGLVTYAAHNVEEAEAVPFWHALDAIGVTLYPPLGADDDLDGRRAVMRATADRLEVLARREGKPVIVAEIGIRSATGAASKPWESAEERRASPNMVLQAEVLADWLAALDRPAIEGVLIWRWFTDPAAGGPTDTDFTVQRKPAERVLACVRTKNCATPDQE
ncbi:MAG: glycoside hydrolase family 113 [Stellaceae bacterium]